MGRQGVEVKGAFAEALPGGFALYGPDAAAIIATGFDQLASYARRDGINRFSPGVERIRQVAAAAAQTSRGHAPQASSGHEDVSWSADSAESESWIGTAEVAEVLGLSLRQSSRLISAGVLGRVRRFRGHYRVHQDEVTAYAAWRREKEPA